MSVLMPDKVSVRGPARFVQGDTRTQLVCFTVPRYSDGVDLSRLGWSIHVKNAAGTEYFDAPAEIPEVRSDKIAVKWLVRGEATRAVGDLTFSLRGAGNDASGNAMRWCSGDEIRPVYAAQESFDENDNEIALSAVETLVQLVQIELPRVIEAKNAANAAANAANTASTLANAAANSAAAAAAGAERAKDDAEKASNAANAAADRANPAADAANTAAGNASAAAKDAFEAEGAANVAASNANAASARLEEGLDAARNALSSAINAENIASKNEQQRVQAENERAAAEMDRLAGETVRDTNEFLRHKYEKDRIAAEAAREDAELQRVKAEKLRVGAEHARVNAEAGREEAETRRGEAMIEVGIAADAANRAAGNAQEAADAANRAAGNAQEAADAAGAIAYDKAPVIECVATGNPITISDASDMPLRDLRLYGRTVQSGTPTLAAPSELISSGADGDIRLAITSKNVLGVDFSKPDSISSAGVEVIDGGVRVVSNIDTTTTHVVARWFADIAVESPDMIGKKFTLSCNAVSAAHTPRIFVSVYNAAGANVGHSSVKSGSGAINTTYEIKEGEIGAGYKLGIALYAAAPGVSIPVGAQSEYTDIQLECGDIATPYEDHQSGGVIVVPTAGGIAGIPVNSGGNYVDAKGQRWLCDEIDLKRGVWIQRVAACELDGSKVWSALKSNVAEGLYAYQLAASNLPGYVKDSKVGICSHAQNLGTYGKVDNSVYFGNSLTMTTSAHAQAADWTAFLAAQHAAGTPVKVLYRLANPVEMPLSLDTIADYAALHTCKPNCVAINDSGAGMRIGYAADTKSYADTLPTASADVKGGVKINPKDFVMDGEMLRVKPERYKLIETIVVDEDMVIERTAEPDGTPYNFKAVTMRIKKDVGVSYSSSFSLQAYFNLAATRSQPLYVPQSTKTTEELWCYAEVRQYKGLWERERALDWSIRNYTATPMLVKIPMYDNAVKNDETIVLLRSTVVARAGTTIEIWGVRA